METNEQTVAQHKHRCEREGERGGNGEVQLLEIERRSECVWVTAGSRLHDQMNDQKQERASPVLVGAKVSGIITARHNPD